jgi:predicted transcriptional regulator
MTFIDFKKLLLDAEISLPKFAKLIKVSEKNIQGYKKKGEVPNTIAVIATCFAMLHKDSIDYKSMIESLELKAKTKKGAGFANKEVK